VARVKPLSNETWYSLRGRQEQERIDLVRDLAKSGYTQTEAADILKVQRTTLHEFIKRKDISWPNKQKRHYNE